MLRFQWWVGHSWLLTTGFEVDLFSDIIYLIEMVQMKYCSSRPVYVLTMNVYDSGK